jgi:hypothetical protein
LQQGVFGRGQKYWDAPVDSRLEEIASPQQIVYIRFMKKITALFLACGVLLLISACTTPEQRRFQEQQQQKALRVANQQRQASLEARCRGYGFEFKTVEFAQCLMKLDQAEQQAAQAQSQRKELESRCALVQAQVHFTTGKSIQDAVDAGNACLAGLPPPRSNRVICRREGRDEVYCFSQ